MLLAQQVAFLGAQIEPPVVDLAFFDRLGIACDLRIPEEGAVGQETSPFRSKIMVPFHTSKFGAYRNGASALPVNLMDVPTVDDRLTR